MDGAAGGAGPAAPAGSALLLHGFTGSARGWEVVADRLRAAGRSVHAVDLPGHGTRAGEADPAAFTLEATIDAIDGALDAIAGGSGTTDGGSGRTDGGSGRTDGASGATDAATLGGRRASLVGYSMGGRLALHYAVRRPERVERLILESASPGLETAEGRAARREADEALATSLEREGIHAFVRRWEALELFASQRTLPGWALEELRRHRLANVPESLAASLRGVGTGALPALWDRLEDVRMPVLLIVGALDRKFLHIGRCMAERLPRARLHVVEGAGHRVHLERPEAWADAVNAFLEA